MKKYIKPINHYLIIRHNRIKDLETLANITDEGLSASGKLARYSFDEYLYRDALLGKVLWLISKLNAVAFNTIFQKQNLSTFFKWTMTQGNPCFFFQFLSLRVIRACTELLVSTLIFFQRH